MSSRILDLWKYRDGALLPWFHYSMKWGMGEISSIEGFVHGLKTDDHKQRMAIWKTWGEKAQGYRDLPWGRDWYLYDNSLIYPGSFEHYALLKKAIRSRIEFSDRELCKDFICTDGPIVGEIGIIDVGLTESDYIRALRETRIAIRQRWSDLGLWEKIR